MLHTAQSAQYDQALATAADAPHLYVGFAKAWHSAGWRLDP